MTDTPSAEELAAMHPELVASWPHRIAKVADNVLTVIFGAIIVAVMLAVCVAVFLLAVWGIVGAVRGILG